MVIKLVFDRQAIPRSTTREAWRVIWRWKRVTEKKMREQEAEFSRMYSNMLIYGTSHPEILRGMENKMMNPPIMLYPNGGFDVDLKPGAVTYSK